MQLTYAHVDEWLKAHHPAWDKSRRTRIQALKRVLNFAVERKYIPSNPIKGYKAPKSGSRITYFTPEQEAALLKYAGPTLRMAIQVCIRTGVRHGVEFATLTKNQINDMGDRMEWKVTPKGTKTSKKYRVVRVTDPTIIAITRAQMEKYPTGPIFRNRNGDPWKPTSLRSTFSRLLDRAAEREKLQFDADACMYTCRHTYAKRTLEGFWTGKPTTIETLARLMGNTPQVCLDHYLQWSDSHTQPLWDAC